MSHLCDRLRERHGIEPTPAQLRAMLMDIRDGRCVLLADLVHSRKYLVSVAGKVIVVFWKPDKSHLGGYITTVLPGMGEHPVARVVRHAKMRRRVHGSASRRKREGSRPDEGWHDEIWT